MSHDLRLWQVGQLVHVWRPFAGDARTDQRSPVLTYAGAAALFEQLRGTHPDLALSIIRRAPSSERVYVMFPDGATVPDRHDAVRLRHRLSKLHRDCEARSLHVSVARWQPLERSREK